MGWLIAEWVFKEGRIVGGACSCRTRWTISRSTKVDESDDPEGTKKSLLDKVKDLHDTLTKHHERPYLMREEGACLTLTDVFGLINVLLSR